MGSFQSSISWLKQVTYDEMMIKFLRYKMKVFKIRTFDEKRALTPKWVMGFTYKLLGM